MITTIPQPHLLAALQRIRVRQSKPARFVPTLTPADLRGMATITIHGPTDPETKARLMRRIQEEMER